MHYVCVKSALERIRPEKAFLYYEFEPKGKWWDQTKKLLTPIKIKAPREIFGNPLVHPAHRADVVRLEALIHHGGIYLDADVMVHESFDHLLDNSVVLGEEGLNAEYGLANAVILAEPRAAFLKRWYDEYHWFRSKGRDQFWSEHSVRLPMTLSKSYPDELTILDHKAFYWPLWTPDHLEMIYGCHSLTEARATLANHLWESYAWEKYLKLLTPGRVRKTESNFHRWVRPFVENLSDDYGLSLIDKSKKFARTQQERLSSRWAKIK